MKEAFWPLLLFLGFRSLLGPAPSPPEADFRLEPGPDLRLSPDSIMAL